MKYAIFDTETSGLFDFSKPAHAEGQPRLASLSMILLDRELREERTIDAYVAPDGWEMQPGAQEVNGLSTEFLLANGRPIADVLAEYVAVIDEGYVLVAFNAQYDTKVMRGELRRIGEDDRFEATPNICVMKASTPVCQIRKKRGVGFKQPKLSEACEFFGITNADAHSARADTRAALEIFLKLHALSALPEPSIRYAVNRPAGAEVA